MDRQAANAVTQRSQQADQQVAGNTIQVPIQDRRNPRAGRSASPRNFSVRESLVGDDPGQSLEK
ncbi:MAG: hypothetical protein SFV51_19525, partial [Bryobacteraceae bacterium]|nr:hypothetical protein [Bryobacteraceae bacterium]